MAYSKTDYLQVRQVPFEALKSHRQLLEQWPIQEDHCLQRVVLDALFQDCWYNHLSRSKPAYRQLDNLQLGQSLQLLSRMEREGKSLVAALNVSSLTFRGKI